MAMGACHLFIYLFHMYDETVIDYGVPMVQSLDRYFN